jgi:hypothetical protein
MKRKRFSMEQNRDGAESGGDGDAMADGDRQAGIREVLLAKRNFPLDNLPGSSLSSVPFGDCRQSA